MKSKKKRTRVAIPKQLRAFFKIIQRKIQAKPQSILMESDDLLQAHVSHGGPCTIYGGLTNAKKQVFGFTYFPENEHNVSWDFSVTPIGVEQIAAGQKEHLTLWKCSSPECKQLYASAASYCSRCDELPKDLDQQIKKLMAKLTAPAKKKVQGKRK
jgi:hypothetical protein